MIDSHQHFWNYDEERDAWITPEMSVIRSDFYPDEDTFRSKGIQSCVAVQAASSEEETLFLLALAEQSDFIRGVVGWVDLQQSDIEDRLAYFSQFETLKGFRHIVQGEKDADFLKKFLNEQGKLLPRRITGNSLKFQRKVSEAVKKARQMAILPYVTDLLK